MHLGTGGRIARDASDRVCVQALRDVSLTFCHGDRVGLIGHNGAGKTTLLRVLAGVYEPSHGRLRCEGQAVALFDPALGMEMEATGYENIFLRGLILGLSPKEIREQAEAIAEFTELGDYLAMPVRTYSSGMMLRLAFAVSTSISPEILLMDEWIVAGDSQFMEKAKKRMESFVGRSNILVLASHSLDLIRRWCDKVVLLEKGRVTAFGSLNEVLSKYNLLPDAATR
jgi:ABC-2 type transport system ATP-binding protein/lipopolysaccharide transport system ATP-binding protein